MEDSPRRLAGRVVVALIADPRLALAVVDRATSYGVLLALACPDVEVVRSVNERDAAGIVAFATGLRDADGRERLLAHVEQRLGPIDAIVTAAPRAVSDALIAAAAADMAARGVSAVARIVAADDPAPAAAGALADLADQLAGG